jgi:hypothetical protein
MTGNGDVCGAEGFKDLKEKENYVYWESGHVDKFGWGMRIAAVGWLYDVISLVIHFINKKKDKFKGGTKSSVQSSAKICCVSYRGSFDERI